MIFESDPSQISRLDSLQLVQLMKRLLFAECRLVGIPLRAATVPLQITVADGGEDGRVEWTGGVDKTDYFPTRFCVFQSKAQNLTESKIRNEILKNQRAGPAKLNAAVSDVLSKKGAYVVFCSHAFTRPKIDKLRKAIESTIQTGCGDPSRASAIEIYDANRIADWVNTHPSVALWLTALHRKRSLAGFLSHDAWGRAPDVHEVPWFANDAPRFAPANFAIPEAVRKDRNRNAWTFEQAAEAVLKFLADEKKVALRIVGPSGFGKSRFAFEVFNRRATAFDEIERTTLIYADLAVVGDETAKLALEIADAGSSTILVVDECPDETHLKLVAIARRVGSRLCLVTIDVETKIFDGADMLVLRLEPAADEMIGAIVRSAAPKLNDSDVQFIQNLAKGFPKMAVLAAQQKGIGAKSMRSVEQFLDRIIWGHRQRNDDAQKALELLSLFEWVGLTGRVAGEGAFIAQELGGMTQDAFIERVKSFGSRGVVIQRGDFIQVTPIPLAAVLGAHRLSLLPEKKLVDFFSAAPDRLKQSLLRRIRWLDTSAEAKAFARILLGTDYFGNLATLNTDFGAESLGRLVHIDPDLAMATIERVFGEQTSEDLCSVNAGRRHLVWALEKLAFRKESFDGAAKLLRRLAASETENNISNNATGQFKQLYQLYLSGTESPPRPRLLVLDDGLMSANPREREVCVEALDTMLDTHHFSRSGGAEEFGSGEHLKDWAPQTNGEIWDFLRAAVKRLTDIAVGNDVLAPRAKQILGAHIRDLINTLPFVEIKEMISCIVSRYGFWIEAVQEVNEWLYFDRREAPQEIRQAVRNYFNELLPSDPVELVVLYTHGWQADFRDPDVDCEQEEPSRVDYKYAERKAIELADVIAADATITDCAIEKLVGSDAKTIFPFARRLAELAPDVIKLFETALAKAEQQEETANLNFFRGLIAGADRRDPKTARDCVRLALRSEKLKKNAISLIGSGKLQSVDIRLVISLLQSHDAEPSQCAVLSHGRGMDHLAVDDIVPLLEELALHGADGLWTVLEIISMILLGGKELSSPLVAILRNVLLNPALFEKASRAMNGHNCNLELVINRLARSKLIDRKFARSLVKQFLTICAQNGGDVFLALNAPVRSALKAIMEQYPHEAWACVTQLLVEIDRHVRRQLDKLIKSERDDNLGPGLLYALPADLYLEWVRKDAAGRASIAVDWLPIVTKADGGKLSWHPDLQAFIVEFANQPDVLAALSRRFYPTSWSGSLVPHLEPFLNLLDSWSTHANAEVRKWARDQINSVRTEIQNERRRDDEDEVRLF